MLKKNKREQQERKLTFSQRKKLFKMKSIVLHVLYFTAIQTVEMEPHATKKCTLLKPCQFSRKKKYFDCNHKDMIVKSNIGFHGKPRTREE